MLASLSEDSVLVGGQALAFWVNRYGVKLPEKLIGAISDDADILGTRRDVTSIAQQAHGKAQFQPQHSMSALIGHITIPVSEEYFVNVDVLRKLVGIKAAAVREHASEGQLDEVKFLVMHPIDVLISRTENLAQLPDKQNDEGVTQLRLAIMVSAQYIREVAEYPEVGQRHAMKIIEKIVGLAKSGTGRKCAKTFGVSFLDALPAFAITNKDFKEIRWPQILNELMQTT